MYHYTVGFSYILHLVFLLLAENPLFPLSASAAKTIQLLYPYIE